MKISNLLYLMSLLFGSTLYSQNLTEVEIYLATKKASMSSLDVQKKYQCDISRRYLNGNGQGYEFELIEGQKYFGKTIYSTLTGYDEARPLYQQCMASLLQASAEKTGINLYASSGETEPQDGFYSEYREKYRGVTWSTFNSWAKLDPEKSYTCKSSFMLGTFGEYSFEVAAETSIYLKSGLMRDVADKLVNRCNAVLNVARSKRTSVYFNFMTGDFANENGQFHRAGK